MPRTAEAAIGAVHERLLGLAAAPKYDVAAYLKSRLKWEAHFNWRSGEREAWIVEARWDSSLEGAWQVTWQGDGQPLVEGLKSSAFEKALAAQVPTGTGLHITYWSFGTPSSLKEEDWGGLGIYEYTVSEGKPNFQSIEGRVSGEALLPPGMGVVGLVVVPNYQYGGPDEPGYDPVQHKAVAFRWIGVTDLLTEWRIEVAEADVGISDVFIVVPGFSTVKFENVPAKVGETLRLPDVRLVPGEGRWAFYSVDRLQ